MNKLSGLYVIYSVGAPKFSIIILFAIDVVLLVTIAVPITAVRRHHTEFRPLIKEFFA